MNGRTVAVVGAGLAGLAAAWTLRERGWEVLVLEAGPEVGGVVRSVRADTPAGPVLMERGPQTLSTRDAELLAFFRDAGLDERMIEADASGGVRYVVRKGRPVRVPGGGADFLSTPLLSARSKLRLLTEPFRGRRGEARPPGVEPMDESVASFIRRRFDAELLDRLVDPFVSGVFAGDPETLALGAVFPEMVEAEHTHGSVVRGLLARARDARKARGDVPRPRTRIVSFEGGLQAWPRRVAEAIEAAPTIPGRVRVNAPVVEIVPDGAEGPGGPERPGQAPQAPRRWSVRWSGSDPGEAAVDAVVLATPAGVSSRLLRAVDPEAAAALAAIVYAPVSVVHAGWPRDRVRHPVDGFGLLAPSVEDRRLLGSLWPGTLFPGRVPANFVLTANFVGGARTPERATLDDGPLVELVAAELAELIGAEGPPSFSMVSRWTEAIPQYLAGHGGRVAEASAAEGRHAGLALAGSWRGGVSLGATWSGGLAAGLRISEADERVPDGRSARG
jgi:protoporphyrinogen/coproporphyrinogen III oxidase